MGHKIKKSGIHTVHGNFSESAELEQVVKELKHQGFQTSDITIYAQREGGELPLSVHTEDDESTQVAKDIFENHGATNMEVLNEGNGDRDVYLSRGVGFGSDSDRVTSRDV